MTRVLRWLTQGLTLHGAARADASDSFFSFERIDAARLHAGDFRGSGPMRPIDTPQMDFAETLPACAFGTDMLLSGRSALSVGRRLA
jgi:hypothetical protein